MNNEAAQQLPDPTGARGLQLWPGIIWHSGTGISGAGSEIPNSAKLTLKAPDSALAARTVTVSTDPGAWALPHVNSHHSNAPVQSESESESESMSVSESVSDHCARQNTSRTSSGIMK